MHRVAKALRGWIGSVVLATVFLSVSATPASSLSPVPTPRGIPMMSEAPDGDVLLFGGVSNQVVLRRDLWRFDTDARAWTPETNGPRPPEGLGAMAFDADSGVAVLYLGVLSRFAPTAQTWLFDPARGRWTDVTAVGAPVGLLGPSMVYDSGSDLIVLFGGLDVRTFAFSDTTWTYNVELDTWSETSSSNRPGGRNFAAMAYEPASDQTVLFGGDTFEGPLNDTWLYDADKDEWHQVAGPSEPSPRAYATAASDSAGGILLFGGVNDPLGEAYGDTWAFEDGEWSNLEPSLAPSPRGFHGMTADAGSGSIVIFGGGPTRETTTNETWLYDPAANVWTRVTG